MRLLAEMKPGEKGTIEELAGDDSAVQRILEMGLTEGEEVEVVRFAPLGDPIELRVRGYNLSIRKRDASTIRVRMGE